MDNRWKGLGLLAAFVAIIAIGTVLIQHFAK